MSSHDEGIGGEKPEPTPGMEADAKGEPRVADELPHHLASREETHRRTAKVVDQVGRNIPDLMAGQPDAVAEVGFLVVRLEMVVEKETAYGGKNRLAENHERADSGKNWKRTVEFLRVWHVEARRIKKSERGEKSPRST